MSDQNQSLFNLEDPGLVDHWKPPVTHDPPARPGKTPFAELCRGLDFGDRTPPEFHPRSGRRLSRVQLEAFAKYKHQYTPCRLPGCSGILTCKSSRRPHPDGYKERYDCDTPLAGEDHYHYCEFVNDEVYLPRTREFARYRTERDVTCPCGTTNQYTYLNTVRDGRYTYYMCKVCNKRFAHDRDTDATRYSGEGRGRAKQSDHTCPSCGSTNTKHKGQWQMGEHSGHQRQCRSCGHVFKIAHLVVTPGALQKLETKAYELTPIPCAWCGDEFTPTKVNQRYCSPQHKKNGDMRAYRARKKQANA